jgi:hypothetical protein
VPETVRGPRGGKGVGKEFSDSDGSDRTGSSGAWEQPLTSAGGRVHVELGYEPVGEGDDALSSALPGDVEFSGSRGGSDVGSADGRDLSTTEAGLASQEEHDADPRGRVVEGLEDHVVRCGPWNGLT